VDDLTSINALRLSKQKTAMTILGGWALGNIALGTSMSFRTAGTTKHFHQMNAGWNVVNLAIAGFGYYTAVHTDPVSLDVYTSLGEAQKLQKLLLFNAGLDMAYIAGGLYLMERAKNASNNQNRLKGFGQSIILQGGFLFAFDVITYCIIAADNSKFQPLLSGDGIGMRMVF